MASREKIREIAETKNAQIADINHSVWEYAEGGYCEYRSAAKLMEVLRAEGFEIEEKAGGIETAFVGTYGSGRPVIGILAEYDALPGLSQKAGEAKHCPIEGQAFGHGCGHSALGAGSVGAALIAKEYLKENGLSGTVKLFGCPAEETGFGKAFMARAHCFDGLDMCFSWHPADANTNFPRAIANYAVRFDFKGCSAHASSAPEQGRSALDACELMNVGVNYLREHVPTSTRLHYAYLDCGGEAPNVVQDHASLLYYVRGPRLSQCSEVLARVKKIARGAALMTETEVNIQVLGGLNDYIPNNTASRLIADAFCAFGGPDFGEEEYAVAREFLKALPEEEKKKSITAGAKLNGISEEEFAARPLNTAAEPYSEKVRQTVMPGSTDVGDVSHIAPTGQYMVTGVIQGTGDHTWQFTAQIGTSIGDKAAESIARAIAYACAEVYENPDLAEQAKKELLEETEGVYVSPLPEDAVPGEKR